MSVINLKIKKMKRHTLLKNLEGLTAESTLVEKDIILLSDKIKKGIAKRHGLK